MELRNKIKFKDLSLPLKILISLGVLYIGLILIGFLWGIIEGIISVI